MQVRKLTVWNKGLIKPIFTYRTSLKYIWEQNTKHNWLNNKIYDGEKNKTLSMLGYFSNKFWKTIRVLKFRKNFIVLVEIIKKDSLKIPKLIKLKLNQIYFKCLGNTHVQNHNGHSVNTLINANKSSLHLYVRSKYKYSVCT